MINVRRRHILIRTVRAPGTWIKHFRIARRYGGAVASAKIATMFMWVMWR